ncbi:hypothetical protein [Streptobacillus ratti]|uniref:hypothetical protein n=1 Tax=Streptobacillus ratti TaxID=1720557 RepID=UPI000934DFD9|nr:hypothetical protein [Streptobacillus ratti]
MFTEIFKTILKLVEKNYIFLILFFIFNILTGRIAPIFEHRIDNIYSYGMVVLLILLLNSILIISLLIVLSKSMGYSVNYKKAGIYLIFYTSLGALHILIPQLSIISDILRMLLVFLPYFFFIENLDLKSSIRFSIELVAKLFIYLLAFLLPYTVSMVILTFHNYISGYNPLYNYLIILINLIMSLYISSLYFTFKIRTNYKKENED